MHPDLSAHLHTHECNILIDRLKNCHKNNKFQRFLGVCSDLDSQVYKCLMKEREANRKKNAELSKEKQLKRKAMADL